MKKFIVSTLLVIGLVTSPFIKIQEVLAATMIEYGLLSPLITAILTGESKGQPYDMSKVHTCTAANTACISAESQLSNAKLNAQVFQAAGIKCIYAFYFKNNRYPTSTETTQFCGTEVSIAAANTAFLNSADAARVKACELKALACKEFPAVANPIQQQFQQIASQI